MNVVKDNFIVQRTYLESRNNAAASGDRNQFNLGSTDPSDRGQFSL